MADIGTAVSYLVAAIDLAEVKSIRAAVRANLLARGGVEGPLGNIEIPRNRIPLETRGEVDTRFHDTQAVQQTPTTMPVQVVRVERNVTQATGTPAVDVIEALPEEPHRHRENGPLVPPWDMPLIPKHSAERPIIKCPPKAPDVINKGSLLDFFM